MCTSADYKKYKLREEWFWSKVACKEKDACWLWMGARDLKVKHNYGRIDYRQNGKVVEVWLTHRVSYALAHPTEDITEKVIRHTCDNPPCVNPRHLLSGTAADNIADCFRRGRSPVGDQHWTRQHPERMRGEQNPNAKLTAEQVREIRQTYTTKQSSYGELANQYQIPRCQIYNILSRRTWKHI